ncbi:MAG: hypothetical protein FJ095_02005 [Deltaproteobacteria bacterium]|nr:hypothetical protein [Deltaproteobacteria bacterium]
MSTTSSATSRIIPALVLGDLTLVRPLARAGVPTVLVTIEPDEPALWSRHTARTLVLPPLEGATELHALRALSVAADSIVGREGPRPLLVYGSDAALAFVARNRVTIESRFAVTLGDEALLACSLDKQRFYERAVKRGVLVPETLDVDEPAASSGRF